MIHWLLNRLTVNLPDKEEAIQRGLQYEYARGNLTLEELEDALEAVDRDETFAHMIAEPFDPDDDRTQCVVCGSDAMLSTVGYSGYRCPACGTSQSKDRYVKRGIVR